MTEREFKDHSIGALIVKFVNGTRNSVIHEIRFRSSWQQKKFFNDLPTDDHRHTAFIIALTGD